YGDSILPTLHPKYRFRNFPNLLEFIFLNFFITFLLSAFLEKSVVWFVISIFTVTILEFLMDGIKMRKAGKNQTFKVSILATSIRLANDFGRIIGHLRNIHLLGITERFDYFMTGEHIQYEKTVALYKFMVYATTVMVIIVIFPI
ncbi:MAG: hypothetical protein P8Y18_06530, partial [Candidatus Bathyarchaeota archaeon]